MRFNFLRHLKVLYTCVIYSPHSVLASLATVPDSQPVQTVDPVLLTLFVSHLVQVVIPKILYVPAGHASEVM